MVDNFTYSKFKNYFLTHKYQSHTNSKKKKENQLEINIDFKYRSYIPADDAIIILKNFIKYIQQEKIQGNFTEQLNYTIAALKYVYPNVDEKTGEPN